MRSNTPERILRALKSGPLYEGALGLILDWPRDFNAALNNLKVRGKIERDPESPQTWRVAS